MEGGQCLYLKNVIAVLIFGIKKGLIFEKGEWLIFCSKEGFIRGGSENVKK